ncbi:hypothetical protein [Ruminiclostridium josui]|uniref:hypothetical protein n=1 Tax=Ruminiclostridium josui TaxID=1499 RepID=UPI000464E821|nr:hypothetical protein [Ruminiclostridium josui]
MGNIDYEDFARRHLLDVFGDAEEIERILEECRNDNKIPIPKVPVMDDTQLFAVESEDAETDLEDDDRDSDSD